MGGYGYVIRWGQPILRRYSIELLHELLLFNHELWIPNEFPPVVIRV